MSKFTGKSLADGQISDSQAALYSVPSGKTAIIRSVHIFNTGSTSETVDLYIKRLGSTARQLRQWVLGANESGVLTSDGETLTLSSEDAIEAVTTTASTVDYVITGATA